MKLIAPCAHRPPDFSPASSTSESCPCGLPSPPTKTLPPDQWFSVSRCEPAHSNTAHRDALGKTIQRYISKNWKSPHCFLRAHFLVTDPHLRQFRLLSQNSVALLVGGHQGAQHQRPSFLASRQLPSHSVCAEVTEKGLWSLPLCLRTQSPSQRPHPITSAKPSCLPKAPPPNTMKLGVRASP